MTKFKVNDRVKIIVPTDEEKATRQANYFDAWQSSPINKYGRVSHIDELNDPYISVTFDEPAVTSTGYSSYSTMSFPEWELEKVLTLDKDDE